MFFTIFRPSNCVRQMSSESTASPTRTPSDVPLISPSSNNGSHSSSAVSPITPKPTSDISSPRISSGSAGPRVAVVPLPQSSAQLPSAAASVPAQSTPQQPTISSLALDSPQRTSLAAHLAANIAATPLNLANIPSGSGTVLQTASPGSSNGIVANNSCTNSSTREMNGTANEDAQAVASTPSDSSAAGVAAVKLDAQRTRRSSRNLEESSRRRSSRSSRQTSAQTTPTGRSAGVPIRPSLDLPLGYGKT